MSQKRYEEIMRRLARQTADPTYQALSDVLDALSVADALHHAQQSAPAGIIAHGPKTLRHPNPLTVGVVIWLRQTGFLGYRTLMLLGVWAQHTDDAPRIIVGHKRLSYAQATYNPEPYHVLIRENYRPYYQDDNRPPVDALLTFDYTPLERLARRVQIRQALRDDVRGISPSPPSA